ncbi:hypothetical protein CPB97_002453 [Podila verticillata]|nr:hypothetical protein CPB97_002453 [Podila verticillata]
MASPSANAARALTQAAVIALLCRRYHDLATWASDPLKQRIHFLAKADGSNLEDLYIWDSQHLTRQQILDFLHQHWSPDHLPLAPPEGSASWESATVYRKKFDQETTQALVPIGHITSTSTNEEASVLAAVLYAEQNVQDDDATSDTRKQGENGLCWKYHNVVSIQQKDLAQWELMNDICHVPINNKSLTKSPVDTVQEVEGKEVDDDSDDDYWGQYGDEDSPSDEEETSPQHSRKHTGGEGDDEDDEDEYWRKYSLQQEKDEAAETKRKMEQSNSGNVDVAQAQATTLPGQVNSTMLSSLLQMLVQGGIQQVVAEEIQDMPSPQDELVPTIAATEKDQDKSEEPTTTTTSVAYIETPRSVCSLSADSVADSVPLVSSQANVMISITLEAAVRQATLEGLSKEQVFALLENVYQSRS